MLRIFFPLSCMLATAKTHQSLSELGSPLSSVFQTHLPLPDWWLEFTPHFLEFAEIEIITFLSQETATDCPISPPIANWNNLCSTLMWTSCSDEVKNQMFLVVQTRLPISKQPRITHMWQGDAEALRERTQQGTGKQRNAAGPLLAASLWGPLSHWQQTRETTMVPCFPRKLSAAIPTVTD